MGSCFDQNKFFEVKRSQLAPYRNQSLDFLCKSIDWFLYDGNFVSCLNKTNSSKHKDHINDENRKPDRNFHVIITALPILVEHEHIKKYKNTCIKRSIECQSTEFW